MQRRRRTRGVAALRTPGAHRRSRRRSRAGLRSGGEPAGRPAAQGLYPPPPGASDLPGLDIAGVVERVGADVSGWHVGDKVCALVQGGGYAEYCIAAQEQRMPIPAGFSFVQAASLPEVYFTAWQNIILLGNLA